MEQSIMKYDSKLLAEYLLSVGVSKNKILNTTQVQKLLYMAYGFFLADKNRILIDETPKAWPYGPVFPRSQKKVDYGNVISLSDSRFNDIKGDKDVVTFFDKLVDRYSVFSASQLSEWSHLEGGPWDLTVKRDGFKWNDVISDNLIKDYFSTINF